jgi:hypothetical protein
MARIAVLLKPLKHHGVEFVDKKVSSVKPAKPLKVFL